ncbi:MAG TPA: AtpZ/AtpI family protein [Chitinophagaceae bacterium]|nr:AtpZ/AtpI family protein [Chitinophagaceae bacterium]
MNKNISSNPKRKANYMYYVSASSQVLITCGLGVAIGIGLDKWTNLAPLFTIICPIFSIFIVLYSIIKKFLKDEKT